jgi:hypothetical protein
MAGPPIHPALPEVIERLAPLERRAGSAGEAEAADYIGQRLRAAGCEANVEPAEFHDGYAKLVGALAAISAGAGLVSLSERGRPAGGQAAPPARPEAWRPRSQGSESPMTSRTPTGSCAGD